MDELSTKQAELTGLRTAVAEMSAASAGTEAKLKCAQQQLESATEKISSLERIAAEQKEAIEIYQVN